MSLSVQEIGRGVAGRSTLRSVSVIMRMSVAVGVGMGMSMGLGVRNGVSLFRERLTGFDRPPPLQHAYPGAGDPASIHSLDAETGPDAQSLNRLLQSLGRSTRVQQRAQKHIAGDAGETVKICNPHELSLTGVR